MSDVELDTGAVYVAGFLCKCMAPSSLTVTDMAQEGGGISVQGIW